MCLNPLRATFTYVADSTTGMPVREAGRPTFDPEGELCLPCGKCHECIKKRAVEWATRAKHEISLHDENCFITLTYRDDERPTETVKKDFQNFMKRYRKQYKNSKVKYYACGEYGTKTLRPHYHAIMFNLPQSVIQNSDKLLAIWQHGHVDIAACTIGSIRYVTKYMMKGRHEPLTDCDDRVPPFSLMSKKMGLNHLTPQMVKHYTEKMISHVTLPSGALTALPRYFRDKIFSKQEKKLLAAEAKLFREYNFQKLFDDSFKKELDWKKAEIRKHNKKVLIERSKI